MRTLLSTQIYVNCKRSTSTLTKITSYSLNHNFSTVRQNIEKCLPICVLSGICLKCYYWKTIDLAVPLPYESRYSQNSLRSSETVVSHAAASYGGCVTSRNKS